MKTIKNQLCTERIDEQNKKCKNIQIKSYRETAALNRNKGCDMSNAVAILGTLALCIVLSFLAGIELNRWTLFPFIPCVPAIIVGLTTHSENWLLGTFVAVLAIVIAIMTIVARLRRREELHKQRIQARIHARKEL